jgi:3-hydroxyisobutyrate dehydrogenase
MKKIAFLGLGAMGSRMAQRLIQAGHDVTLWNRSAQAVVELLRAQSGNMYAKAAATPRDAVFGADVVFSMVTDDDASREVWLSANTGAIDGIKIGAIVIESSTVSPDWISALDMQLNLRGASLLDAPVAGSRPQADAGQLIFMVGGDAIALEEVKPVLAPLAAAVHHVGPSGRGAVLKLAVNALFASQLQTVAELLGYLKKKSIAPEAAAALLAQFPIVAPAIGMAAKMMASNSPITNFTIDLLEKDLRYVLVSAERVGATLPGTVRTHEGFEEAQKRGFGQRNFSALAALYA